MINIKTINADVPDDIAMTKASDHLGFLQEHFKKYWRAFTVIKIKEHRYSFYSSTEFCE